MFTATLVGQLPTRVLAGRVVDERGKALAGVAVCLIDKKHDPFITKHAAAQPFTITGADGVYTAPVSDDIDDSSHHLLFVVRGRVHVSTQLEPHDQWPVVLPRAHTLVGRVVDEHGKPVANVRVEARDWLWQARYRAAAAGLNWLPTPLTAVRTNARGSFVIPGTLSSGVQLVAGEAFQRSNPVSLGEPIELVLPGKDAIHENSPRRTRWRRWSNRKKKRGQKDKDQDEDELAEPIALTGTTGLKSLPPNGLSIRLVAKPKRAGGGLALGGGVVAEVSDYFDTVPVRADGSFAVAAVPGDYVVQLVIPRPLLQGAPDVIDGERVTIAEDQKTLALDLRAHMPIVIRGTVRSFAPAGRLLVGASVKSNVRGHYYGYAHYECALVPVTPDGSFSIKAPPGECSVFVLDLWTGMLLHREPVHTYQTGDEPVLAMDVVAGACDLELAGAVSTLSWIEMIVESEWWPKGIDRMNISHHDYTKRIGPMIPPGTKNLRLYLPPCDVELWLVVDDQGDLKRDRGEAFAEVVASERQTVTIDVPKH
jgi:hypothetical protein